MGCYQEKLVHLVVECYCQGMAVLDISQWVGISPENVNIILDHYAPCL